MNVRIMAGLFGAVILAACSATAFSSPKPAGPGEPARRVEVPAIPAAPVEEAYLQREVGHQLRSLLYYTVFDIIKYRIAGNNVILDGAVTQPYVKSDAEKAVKSIEGVGMVINHIKVLPVSAEDDRIRRAVFHAIYGEGSSLFHYAMAASATIHIIVEGGHVTLEGTVDSLADKNAAEIFAKTVPGAFSVTNNLQVLEPVHH